VNDVGVGRYATIPHMAHWAAMEVLLLVGAAVGAAGILGWRLYSGSDWARSRKAPRLAIARFEDGAIGRIDGRVRYVGEPLTALLSRRSCAYFEAARLSDSEAPGPTATVVRGQDFLVEDATGTALVRYAHARVRVRREPVSTPALANAPEELSDDDRAALEEWCEFSKQGWRRFDEGYLVEEGVLSAGDEVSVIGCGIREPSPDPAAATGGYRDGAKRLVMQSTKDARLLIRSRGPAPQADSSGR
jgi:hypothetical protein